MADTKPSFAAGCTGAFIALFISTPLWMVLLFGMLARIDAPTWMWVVHWTYLPFQVCAAIAIHLARLMDAES
jgi:hypothetical protein